MFELEQFTMTKRLTKYVRSLIARPRLLMAVAIALACYAVLTAYMRAPQAVLLAFDIGAIFFLASIVQLMSKATPAVMRRRAERQIYGKWTVVILSIITIGMVLLALHDELRASKAQAAHSVVFAGLSIVLSWLLLATNFAQEYAHQYALNRHINDGGLQFPSTPEPDYWDFMYFSLILSMACQTADVQITDGRMRRLALLHSVMAFFFNVGIISITINILGGVL
jgi:uncharacterized membrane protein